MIIYKITNNINGKVYIGQTISNLDKRWGEHLADAKMKRTTSYLHNAINKYGKENFYKKIIWFAKDIYELNIYEKFWIKYYKSENRNMGYNIQSGGTNSSHSKLTKNSISRANKGHVVSLVTREKIRKGHLKTKRKGIKFKGVCYEKESNKYIVTLSTKKKRIKIGRFCTEIDAANAHDKAVILYGEEWQFINFEKNRKLLIEMKRNNKLFIKNGY